MKLNKIMVAMGFGLVMAAGAANAADGKVTIKGTVTTAPCSIDSGSLDQAVEMGSISEKALLDGKQSGNKNFTIKLENCQLDGKKSVKVTFKGVAAGADDKNFGVTGTAAGISLGLITSDNTVVSPNAPVTLPVSDNANELTFTTFVQGDKTDNTDPENPVIPITAGSFSATLDFTMDYI
ncbi:fimbrial protein [Pantoea sp. BRR-3P]|uniref:fimbrial protein n=1 Tax=Pantoea sp. BRR-3P TaxID=3141541 RepID=UPI0031F53C2A